MTDGKHQSGPLISMALIVRDGAATLDRCLASLVGQVDEIIIVDIGSTDDTRAIRYTDRVFDFVWVDDFATARQFAHDQANGEWVGWQDADEVLVGVGNLRGAVAEVHPAANQILWRTLLGSDRFGQPLLTYWRERLVRNDGRHRWSSAVHENLVAVDPATAPSVAVRFEAVQTRHEDAVGGDGSDRNLRILLASVARTDNPSRSVGRSELAPNAHFPTVFVGIRSMAHLVSVKRQDSGRTQKSELPLVPPDGVAARPSNW